MSATMPTDHMEHLALANEARLARSQLRLDVAAKRISVVDVLRAAEVPNCVTVLELLKAQPRWGNFRVLRFLADLQIPEGKRVNTLTDRQRNLLCDALEGKS